MRYHHSDDAPQAIGPYSQAVEVDGWLFTSGQVALHPQSGEMVEGDFAAQARQVFANLGAVLAASGCSFSDVVKATVYITDFADFPCSTSSTVKRWARIVLHGRPCRWRLCPRVLSSRST